MAKELTKAVAYLRTSSKTNVGPDKDSDKRQLAAINRYAKSAGYEIVGSSTTPPSAAPTRWPAGPSSPACSRRSWPMARERSSSRSP